MRITPETHGKLALLNWRTLSDKRAANVRPCKEIQRAAFVMTGRCNFACPYCQTLGGSRAPTMGPLKTTDLVRNLIKKGLKELRLSGGEPTLLEWLPALVYTAASRGVSVAVSTNGYSHREVYENLVAAGVSEFSISLDTLDPQEADELAGGRPGVLPRVLSTIQFLASKGIPVYIGMCCSKQTPEQIRDTVDTVEKLGVADVKIMSPAQDPTLVDTSWLTDDLKARFPFLAWRSVNFRAGRDVRGLDENDSHKCPLVLDDVTVVGDKHYPCNVYFREGGEPIGTVGANTLEERAHWYKKTDTHKDPICRGMCMDLLRTYNNRVRELNPEGLGE